MWNSYKLLQFGPFTMPHHKRERTAANCLLGRIYLRLTQLSCGSKLNVLQQTQTAYNRSNFRTAQELKR